jgi:putative peptidoglycan lipid II flippase
MSRILPAARTVVVFGVILQVAGFVKLLVIANYFGMGARLDAYYLALIIPTFAVGVAGGMMQTSFVAAYVTAKTRGTIEAAHRLAGFALTWSVLALAAVALLSSIASGPFIQLVASGAKAETREQLRLVFVPLVCMAPLMGLADCGAMLLNVEGRFTLAACAPLLNAIVGTLVLMACRNAGAYALVWSLMAGLLAQAVVVLFAIRGARIPLRPQFSAGASIPDGVFTAVALPVLISNVLGNVVLALIQMISAPVGVGAVSAMAYASRLHNSLVQAVVLSASAVLLPHFARLTAEGRTAELRSNLERVFAATLLFSAAAVVLIAVSGPRLVGILLQRGNFTPGDANLVGSIWLALTAGLLGSTWSIFLARFFQAQRMPWVIAGLACISVIANVTLALALRPAWGVIGVALANALAYTLVMVISNLRADRAVGRFLTRTALAFTVKMVLGNLVAYAAALACGTLLEPFGPVPVVLAQAVVVIAINLLLARSAPLGLTLRALVQI